MAITGIAHTDLAVLMGNTDFRIYEIHRDMELEEMVIDRAKYFWEEHVLTHLSPPAQTESDLKRLFPLAKQQKTIRASQELYELTKKMSAIQEQITSYEEDVSQIKQSIMAHMQDAEILTYQDQILATWKAPKPSLRVDTKRLSMDHPKLMTEYQVPVLNSRRLVVKELA
jgi:predicted phage-related endonuclease